MPTKPSDDQIRFEADSLQYARDTELVTATGNVVLRREEQTVRVDAIVWNRKTGVIEASGNIRFVDESGNVLYTDKVELTDALKAGAIEDMLVVLRGGGRLAARQGKRDDKGNLLLDNAVYSGCDIEDGDGCPKSPSWEITAVKVTFDVAKKRVYYKGATLRLFGLPLLSLPGLSHRSGGRASSGLLIPDFRLSASNGAEVAGTYYWRLDENRDLSITTSVFTAALPMVSGRFRQLTSSGAYQLAGYVTQSGRINAVTIGDTGVARNQIRGYFEANGRFQLSENWSLTGYGRYASDRTFLRRYDISRENRLRSTINLERIDADSYFSLAGWAAQTLRAGDQQGLVPIALPALDYRRRLDMPGIGGKLELEINSLAISRSSGQDTQRAFARAQWDRRFITGLGQEITLTGLLRSDVYHSSRNDLTSNAVYRGTTGWQGRGIATAAIDVKWPLIGSLLGGTQVLTPRFQIVATPRVRNLAIPNEDSRAIELETSNLFSLNRFPGYDRIEDGARFTYGLDWQVTRPGWRVFTTIGQSYRLTNQQSLLPDGTGLATRRSDIVGRTQIRFRDIVQLTHRFRLDKDSFALRRNELDATVGNHRTYVEVGYLRLNRNIATAFEELRDREELRLAGRVAFAKYWSLFGSGVLNLTPRNADPTNASSGFNLLRHRLGVAYTDDCLDLGFTWRRDYVTTGDAQKGNSFQLTLSLRNLGGR
ncbi:LPS-assembly protein LptD [Novosphingobium sp. Chol11]|uniref:LPS-assembly protein LptD n=1 Tax=Novosphingobium sp. Chol11 TaxID=1385763 RepID=UPI00345BE4C9